MKTEPLTSETTRTRPGDDVAGPDGEFVTIGNEDYYRISDYDQLPPFFMSIVSDSNHWLFVSSTGGLSAGRVNSDSALFPYYTEDRISENSENTGPKTVIRVQSDGVARTWEPFSRFLSHLYTIKRNIYKNLLGNKVLFEEENLDLGLTFTYSWASSDRFGFVRSARLYNHSGTAQAIEVLDGLQNILPYGASEAIQVRLSVLLDAYKRNELHTDTELGIFSLSSTLTDLAEPSESLKASTVWQVGLADATYLLSSRQIESFRSGNAVNPEVDVKGYRGAFLVASHLELADSEDHSWHLIADVNQDGTAIGNLIDDLTNRGHKEVLSDVLGDVERGSLSLIKIVGSADGQQLSADRSATVHHFANVLFNSMRGGIFVNQYEIPTQDLSDFFEVRNRPVKDVAQPFLSQLPDTIAVADLLDRARATGSDDIVRLCLEYLPLTFSRRHGDPSRPWNRFSINIKKEDGSQWLDYQGNWRDIFQNWEALAYSYSDFAENMVAKFLNATTADGYNPYRVTRNGIEWEVPDPEDQWANIGYWSDHQIIYLLKLLEVSQEFHPGTLEQMLSERIFSHANVPYRIKSYQAMLNDWYDTIDFDENLDGQVTRLVAAMGTDGRLLLDSDGRVVHVSMIEKLLILLLAKMVNFVPEGGVWMNTQRPEWNDANNALVGKGMSMVTTAYLRRYVVFLQGLISSLKGTIDVGPEVNALFHSVHETLQVNEPILDRRWSDRERRGIMDRLGEAGSAYREVIYTQGVSTDLVALEAVDLRAMLNIVQRYLDQTIRLNRRDDGLYHAYNILALTDDTAGVEHLYEMLEGQVAVLSSKILTGTEAVDLLDSLRNSALYRPDQNSYILYPDRELPGFLEKNRIPQARVEQSVLLSSLIEAGDPSLVTRDVTGTAHFNGAFRNERQVHHALDALANDSRFGELVEKERHDVLDLFEEIFQHSSFTGRSGTFFGYEGLGSIYWHMVSKLLLAVQEQVRWGIEFAENTETIRALSDRYYAIREGVGGFNKSPAVYGAFPTDPYSHTPAGKGAKQPGMTGQVKEEILTRMLEQSVLIDSGAIHFESTLLREAELIGNETRFQYVGVDGGGKTIRLPGEALAFTFSQVPVVVKKAHQPAIDVTFSDGTTERIEGLTLPLRYSRQIFKRSDEIQSLTVLIQPGR